MKKLLLVLLLSSLVSAPFSANSYAQRKSKSSASASTLVNAKFGADQITAAQLRDYLYFIASDEMEGRDTPSRGLDTTAKFIAMNLSRWGFKPGGGDGSYFQTIPLERDRLDADATHAEINGQSFKPGEDFIAAPVSATLSGPLVYAGNGWLVKSKGIDAFKGIDVKGRTVVVLGEGLPKGVTRADLSGKRGEDWSFPQEYAQKAGAKGLIEIPDFSTLVNWDRLRQSSFTRGSTHVKKLEGAEPVRLPSVVLSVKMATALLQGEKFNITNVVNGGLTGQPVDGFDLNPSKNVNITITVKSEAPKTQNVVGIFEGSDPLLKNEYVASGAHYDHLGIGTPINGDAIYNGADDDGSGTTALLAMAEALSHASLHPKRSILFVWHAGEEKGLWGSQYFTEHPTVPLDHVITQLNIDMIGRSKKAGDTNPANAELSGPNEIYVIGSKMMSSDLGRLSEEVNKSYLDLNFNYRYDDPSDPNRFFFRSDHYNYAHKGIPIIFYFDGVHEDYHRPSDSPDKIDYQKMEKVARTVYVMMWDVANLPARPKIDKELPAQLSGN